MQNQGKEPEQPTAKTRFSSASRAEILLVGVAWALFLFALLAGLRIWIGPLQ